MFGPLANFHLNSKINLSLYSHNSTNYAAGALPLYARKSDRVRSERVVRISIIWSASVPKDLQYEITSRFYRTCLFRVHALEKIGQS